MSGKEFRPIDEMTFKEASVELEQVVRMLEGGDLELEEALTSYQRGVELLASLRERLASAEQRVQVLVDAAQQDVAPDTAAAPAVAFIDE
ncbi:MAG: exodeoxyribonuclease VII small subunit [Atopobiaceae bacterium]|nr:exodeoxyribonuclease VII small subunit [Atopobiaceae bacterium]MBQ3282554.1 exodeoxyribonuclease VII small subunit [Atopobiaceae bacterium]MBQ6411402.1 exodeoxyribonuclease VII small subunit [Atopobiaceae bacterium]MBQ6651410.1 exodeoxyribonuclease VII small subunit [Atopobiaceae bacterium]MBR3385827.1 exodeoxyribonuclease VII small subunit [Atopobiaceae bacterium]